MAAFILVGDPHMAMSLDDFIARRGSDRRLARLTHDVALPAGRGLEFGALATPTCLPEGIEVEYVDYGAEATAEHPDATPLHHIWTGAGDPPFAAEAYDFAIAAQVAQYVPNLLGWMRGVYRSLRVGGVLNLSLPDRRFMFDIKRKTSTLGELLEAYYLDYNRPSLRQVFDHTHQAAAIDPLKLWDQEIDLSMVPPFCGEHALALAHKNILNSKTQYTLARCWIFTPLSFLDLIEDASRLKLCSFVISQFASTEPRECEFFVCLRRDSENDPETLLNKQLNAIEYVRQIAQKRHLLAKKLSAD
jgi:SAM-dependent methyltransferase